MNDGNTDPTPRRGRSQTSKNKGGDRKTGDTSTEKTRPRSGSTSKTGARKEKDERSRSRSKEKKARDARKQDGSTERTSTRTPPIRHRVMEEEKTPTKSRAIKIEAMEQAKVQQTLAFSTKNREVIDMTGPPGDTGDKEQEGSQSQALVMVTPGGGQRTKRKQGDISHDRGRTSGSVVKRNTPNNRKGNNRPNAGGRGGGIDTAERRSTENGRIQGPPDPKSIVDTEKGFELQRDENIKLLEQMERSLYLDAKEEIEEDKEEGKEEAKSEGQNGTTREEGDKGISELRETGGVQINRMDRGPGTETPISNRYTKTQSREGTPILKNGGKAVSYVSVARSPQKVIKTHERRKEKHDSFFEVTFSIKGLSQNPSTGELRLEHAAQLRSILLRAKEVDRKAKINAWDDKADLPTIARSEDIPQDQRSVTGYLAPPRPGASLHNGRNSNWRVRITTRISRDEFLHHWGLSKREFTKTDFVTIRSTPLQAPTYHAAGYFLNSADGQLVYRLEEELSKELGHKVGVAYKPAALDKRAADTYWRTAKKARYDAPEFDKSRAFFKLAPMVMQVYAETKDLALKTAITLVEKYGRNDKDGLYPRMPDGTRMRFVAASAYLDMQGRSTAARIFHHQVLFSEQEITAPIPIRDPDQRFPSQNNRTMHELVMDAKDPTQKNEPYFRCMKRKFHWNYKTREWEVSIQGCMFDSASKILRRFKEYMTETYGEEVGEAIMQGSGDDPRHEYGSNSGMGSGISIATDDRYLNGDGRFVILGLEKVKSQGKNKTPREIRNNDEDENTMNLKSTVSSGETGNTVPSAGGMDERSMGYYMSRTRDESSGTQEQTGSTNKAEEESDEDELMDSTGPLGESEDPGEWKTVEKGKGAKPRVPTLYEKALHLYASTLSGSGRGNDP